MSSTAFVFRKIRFIVVVLVTIRKSVGLFYLYVAVKLQKYSQNSNLEDKKLFNFCQG